MVERGTLPGQRTVLATLADVAERGERRGHPRAGDHARRRRSPALRERLAWLESRPLHGRTVAVTRARAQASALAARLRGARRRRSSRRRRSASSRWTAPLPDARRLRPRLRDVARTAPSCCSTACATPARSPGVTVAAIGPGTARALRAHGIEPDVVPERAVAEGLVEALADVPVAARAVARAAEGRDVLPDALRERGAQVDVVALYETVAEPLDDATRDAAARRRLPALHVGLVGALLRRRRAARSTARGWSRSARRRATSCARTAPSRTSRPTRTRPTAWSTRCSLNDCVALTRPITFLSDYGLGDEFVGVVHGVIARICPEARASSTSATACRAHDVRAGARGSRGRCRTCPPACTSRSSTRRSARAGARSRCGRGEDRLLVGPDNGLLIAGRRALRRRGRGGRDLGLAVATRAGLGHVPRPRRVRPGRRAARRRGAARPRGRAARPGRARRAGAIAAAPARTDALVAHVVEIDASATWSSTRCTATSSSAGCGSATRSPPAPTPAGCAASWRARSPTSTPGALLLYEDAGGALALAVNGGNAAALLGLRAGDEVRLERA